MIPPPAQLVVVGGGGHGREIIQILRDVVAAGLDVQLIGVLADGYWDEANLARAGTRRIGPVSALATYGCGYVIAIGDGEAREQIELAAGPEQAAAVLVHPTATVGNTVDLGPGCVLFPGVRVTADVRLGRHVHVNVNASISHDCVVDDFATIAPGCAITGGVTIGRGATIGAGAVVLPGLDIGAGSIIGAGAVVRSSVEASAVVAGVPARVIRHREPHVPRGTPPEVRLPPV